MLDLKNKSVLLICPQFFGYEQIIKNEIEQQGATVDMVFENLDFIYFYYAFIYAHFPRFKTWLLKKYYFNHLPQLITNKDYVFVIRGSSLSLDVMEMLRKKAATNCKFVMYQWDSVKHNTNALAIGKYFDKIATFDKEDAKNYCWEYRPLFYVDSFLKKNNLRNYDILFMGRRHSQRLDLLNKLKEIAQRNKYKLKGFLFLKRKYFIKEKYIFRKSEMVNACTKDFTFVPISIQGCYDLYCDSSVVVDYTHPGQAGLTIRTIEALGCRCKLITNNVNIKQADFYDENNILIYSGTDICVPREFVENPYKDIEKQVFLNYSINKWLDDLLGDFDE